MLEEGEGGKHSAEKATLSMAQSPEWWSFCSLTAVQMKRPSFSFAAAGRKALLRTHTSEGKSASRDETSKRGCTVPPQSIHPTSRRLRCAGLPRPCTSKSTLHAVRFLPFESKRGDKKEAERAGTGCDVST